MTAVAIAQRDVILQQVADGVMLDDVANSLGIAAPNISKHLANDPEYKAARESGIQRRLYRSRSALAKLAEEDEARRLGKLHGNLARVRAEVLSADQWFAERELSRIYGSKQQLTVDLNVNLDGALMDARDRLRAIRTVADVPNAAGHTALLPSPADSGDT